MNINNDFVKGKKVYVKVTAAFSSDGKLTPLSLTWEDGQEYPIDRVLDIRPSPALKGGGRATVFDPHVRRRAFSFLNAAQRFRIRISGAGLWSGGSKKIIGGDTMRIRSAVDFKNEALIFTSIALILVGALYLTAVMGFSVHAAMIGYASAAAASAILLWFLFGTFYELREDYLYCKCVLFPRPSGMTILSVCV
jgi:hypothetical protein